MSVAVAHDQVPDGPFSVDDLDRLPEIGLRYELIEGTLLMSAAPSRLHQLMATRLCEVLTTACPPELVTLAGPVEVQVGPTTLLQPDALVVRSGDVLVSRDEAPPPLVVIEVASPSTRRIDEGSKRRAYRTAGVGAYWMADPHVPSVRVIRWEQGTETDVTVAGDETLAIEWPAPLELRPSDLVHLPHLP